MQIKSFVYRQIRSKKPEIGTIINNKSQKNKNEPASLALVACQSTANNAVITGMVTDYFLLTIKELLKCVCFRQAAYLHFSNVTICIIRYPFSVSLGMSAAQKLLTSAQF